MKTSRHPQAKSPIGRLLSLDKEDEAKALILEVAKQEPTVQTDRQLCERLKVHRQSLWRWDQRLELRDDLERIYMRASLGLEG